MEQKDAIEIYKIQHDRFEKGKDIQWKFNTATWTLVVLAIANAKDLSVLPKCAIWILCILFAIAHASFVIKVQLNLNLTKAIWMHIVDRLNYNATDIVVDVENMKKKGTANSSGWFWVTFQIVVTLILLTTFLLLIYSYQKTALV